MTTGLAGAASRGALWLGLVNLLSKGSQVLVTLALGIYLSAGELGTVTVTVALVNLALVVQSAGVYDVISRTTEEPRRFSGTVMTLSTAVGGGVALLAVALAPTIAGLVGAPGAGDLLRIAVLSLPFTAMAGVQMAYLHRGLDFRRRLVPDAGSALTGAAVTVACAAAGLGEWSLVAGLLTTAVLAPVLGLAVGIRVSPRWSGTHARTVGRWAAVTGPGAVLGLVLLNLDYVVISRALGEEATGIYSFAYRIAFVPYVMGAVVLGGVAFPLYARLAESGGAPAMAPAVVRFLHVLTATTVGAYLALLLLADRIVVIDPRWAASAPVLRVLTVYGVLLGLVLMGHEALRASGRPGHYLRAQIVHVVVLLVAAVALVRSGIVGVAWAQVVAVAVAALVVAAMLRRAGLLGAGLVRAVLAPLGAAALVAVLHEAARRADILPPADSLWGGTAMATLVLASYLGALVVLDRPLVQDVRAAMTRS